MAIYLESQEKENRVWLRQSLGKSDHNRMYVQKIVFTKEEERGLKNKYFVNLMVNTLYLSTKFIPQIIDFLLFEKSV